MDTEITFKQACALLRTRDKQIIGAVDALGTLVLALSPIALGPAALPALGLIGVKNELLKVVKRLMKSLHSRLDDPIEREQRLASAFCITCYAAFFSELADALPELRRLLSLPDNAPVELKREILATMQQPLLQSNDSADELDGPQIALPHPAGHYMDCLVQLEPLYATLSSGLLGLVIHTDNWTDAGDESRMAVRSIIGSLPSGAQRRFQSYYFSLASAFDEFYIWSNLQEHTAARMELSGISETVTAHLQLAKQTQRTMDIGLATLGDTIATLPARIAAHEANEALAGLARSYEARVNEPILDDKGVSAAEIPSLFYPTKANIFIPQAIRVLRHSRGHSLEDPAAWDTANTYDALGSFLFRYLNSPYSLESPLLVLGHPGSGKSLLTQLLAARLSTPAFTPIRIELRDSDADNEIQGQIEEQIKKDTGRDVNWATLSDFLGAHPPVLLFDGYDELLQASGKVFANYLVKVREFQRREAVLGRPVRAIVTSRITLIDKAIVPDGATVVRLAPFDEERRKRWIAIWNRHNAQYFAGSRLRAFRLPNDANLIPLAEQPLLLLMLALYDSDGNALANSRGLDRTQLYASLITRFIVREREKEQHGETWGGLSPSQQDHEVQRDVERLGAAALGMFNRRNLHILSGELNEDLRFFQMERSLPDGFGGRLSQADLVLGGFFFVQESRSGATASRQGGADIGVAFEFLHNTFGEFLTADFILRSTLTEAHAVNVLNGDPALKLQLLQKLESPDGLPARWYTSLMYTPLFSRPVVFRLMKEWCQHYLNRNGWSPASILTSLDMLITNEVERLVGSNAYPSIMLKDRPCPCGSRPLMGYAAMYTINLILLRVALDPGSAYVFDDVSMGSFEEGIRPWHRLSHLWRSWFSLESLKGLADLITVESNEHSVSVRLVSSADRYPSWRADHLQSVIEVARSLGDNLLTGLGGLAAYDASHTLEEDTLQFERALDTEGVDVRFRVLVESLRHRPGDWSSEKRRAEISRGLGMLGKEWLRWPSHAGELVAMAAKEFGDSFVSSHMLDGLMHEFPYILRMQPELFDRMLVFLDDRARVMVANDVLERWGRETTGDPSAALALVKLVSSVETAEALGYRFGPEMRRMFEDLANAVFSAETLGRLSVERPSDMFELLSLASALLPAKAYDEFVELAFSMCEGEYAVRSSPREFSKYVLREAGRGTNALLRDWVMQGLGGLSVAWWSDIPSAIALDLLEGADVLGLGDEISGVVPDVVRHALAGSVSWDDAALTMLLVRVVRRTPPVVGWFLDHLLDRQSLSPEVFPVLRNPVWRTLVGSDSRGKRFDEPILRSVGEIPVAYLDDLVWLLDGLQARGYDPERVRLLRNELSELVSSAR